MPLYSYEGKLASGKLTRGTLDASSPITAAKALMGKNIVPVNIVAGGDTEALEKEDNISMFTPQVSIEDLVMFCRQMYSLANAGVPIMRAVRGLANTITSKRLKIALMDIQESLERGRTLSSALNNHPDIFNQLFVSIVHVGENTGKLDISFKQLAGYLEREQATRKQIKSATRYPTFVIGAIVIAMVIMNIFVIPIFADMFTKFGAELPLMTRILLTSSELFITQWHILLISCIALFFGTKKYFSSDSGAYQWDKIKLQLPIVGSIFKRSLLSRFARSFSMMLAAGVPLNSALSLVAEAVNNRYMEEKILGMRGSIERGESLGRVAGASGLFTPLVMQMISVGEETGRIDELLEEVAGYYESEVDYDLQNLTAKIEPILISIVAGMVLVLALGIFTPMWDMMGAIKG
ncbi:type II secretion system F family protein [Opacimonas viscosa]|uniref:Type II secretion system F family protein n=1 Tax=Opacimonas viscosa TaxID=2961944 RepID=A0AA41X453_9ALTE|nr:type II secretion system F family protein [Opacimonas viscosa]MCP3429678.1 type II secretion system F family protein [Opacimonas viscosa]